MIGECDLDQAISIPKPFPHFPYLSKELRCRFFGALGCNWAWGPAHDVNLTQCQVTLSIEADHPFAGRRHHVSNRSRS